MSPKIPILEAQEGVPKVALFLGGMAVLGYDTNPSLLLRDFSVKVFCNRQGFKSHYTGFHWQGAVSCCEETEAMFNISKGISNLSCAPLS